jgi:hypothetical protein
VAVLLALVSGFLFGAMTVALRFALRRAPGAELGALVTVTAALAVALVAFAVSGEPFYGGGLGWFVLGGALAPTASQLLVTFAVRDVGPSRTSVVVGAAPLFALAIAFPALDEPVRVPLVVGALLVVCGGVLLVAERGRPEHLKPIGLLLAAASAVAIASRDNIARWLLRGTTVPTLASLVVLLCTGTALTLVWLLLSRGRARAARRRGAAVRPGRGRLRALVRVPVRGVRPRARERRVADRRYRVALGCRALGAVPAPARGGREEAPPRRSRRRRRRRADRRLPLARRDAQAERARRRRDRAR